MITAPIGVRIERERNPGFCGGIYRSRRDEMNRYVFGAITSVREVEVFAFVDENGILDPDAPPRGFGAELGALLGSSGSLEIVL